MMKEEALDKAIREAARSGAADGFGPFFATRVVAASTRTPEVPARLRLIRSGPSRLAAAAVIVLVAVLGTFDATRLRTIEAPAGETVATRLPDGSSVSLGPGSSISYRKFFLRNRRHIQLNGEAFFDVESDPKPFVVETFNSQVWVTGTRFNVRGWEDDRNPETIISLEEGRVEVYRLSESARRDPIRLVPGDAVRVNAEGAAKDERIAVVDALSWQQGGISLVDVPLVDAVAQISRRFAIRIDTEDAISDRPTTYVTPRARSAEDALDAISFALDLRYRRILGGFRIESPSPDSKP